MSATTQELTPGLGESAVHSRLSEQLDGGRERPQERHTRDELQAQHEVPQARHLVQPRSRSRQGRDRLRARVARCAWKASETLREAIERWRASRVDVTEATRALHRVALNRVIPVLGTRPVDEITTVDVNELVTTLAEKGKRRETIRKSVKYLASVLDESGRDPNPARSKSIRLPPEEYEELNPPDAAAVLAVYRLLPSAYKLPLLWLDWSGARVGSVDSLTVGDYDERDLRVRLKQSTTKTRAALWVDLPLALSSALEATLPPREDRNPAAPLFPGCSSDRLRTAIGRACRATGTPLWSPHDLRHRRISLLHRQGRSWAEIARFVGQRKLSLTADTYTHVLSDGRELDYGEMLG